MVTAVPKGHPAGPLPLPVFFLYPPHPAAEVFPLLPDDELDELAADIRAHGLLMPLLVGRVDGQMVLVDGRNRREACWRAGITPSYTLLVDGEDLSARAISENVYRRHLTKSQRAMVVAKLIGLGYGKGKSQICDFDDDNPRTAENRLSRTRTVLNHASDLADSVLNGSISLDNAYEEVRLRKGQAETYEARFERRAACLPIASSSACGERMRKL